MIEYQLSDNCRINFKNSTWLVRFNSFLDKKTQEMSLDKGDTLYLYMYCHSSCTVKQ